MGRSLHTSNFIFRRAVILLLLLGIVFCRKGSAQKQKIDLSCKDLNIIQVFQEIEKKTKYGFFCKNDQFDLKQLYTFHYQNTSVQEILWKLLDGEQYSWQMLEQNIVITRRKKEELNRRVWGKIKDSQGRALPGVSVFVRSAGKGSTSDLQGHYELSFPKKDSLLSFSFVGMKLVEKKLSKSSRVDVCMYPEILDLDEIIITGVIEGTARKKVGFTVEKLNQEEMESTSSTSLSSALAGKIAGLKVSSYSGAPGTDSDIQLRGATSIYGGAHPLIIIDGVLTEGNLRDINLQDIANIEVVKGAAASSLYGSRAANGVINITSKRGNSLVAGQTEVILRSDIGYSYIPFVPEKTKATNVEVTGGKVDYSSPSIDGVYDNLYPATTDPVKEFFRAGFYNTNYLSFRSNSKEGSTSLFSSLEYADERGVVKLADGMSRVNFRMNADHNLSEKLKFSGSNLFSRSKIDHRADGIWDQFYYADPDADLSAPNEEDGSPYNVDPNKSNPLIANPLYQIANTVNEEERSRYLGHFCLKLQARPNLNLKASYGIDKIDVQYFSLTPKNLLQAGKTERTVGSIFRATSTTLAQSIQLDGFYHRRWGDFSGKLKAQYLYESNSWQYHSGSGTHLAVEGKEIRSLEQASENININSESTSVVAQNFSGIIYLDYKDKYILDALVRRDGVSLFGENERWQTFYRLSAAWRLTQDWKLPEIQELKLRASCGLAGLRPPFQAQYEVVDLNNGMIGAPISMGNKDLKSSRSKELEVGVDATFAKHFDLMFNYARSLNSDQILQVPVSAVTGFQSQWQNAGELESEVWEASLGIHLLQKKEVSWDVHFTWDKMKQVITKLDRPAYAIVEGGVFRIEEGKEFGTLYGHVFARSLDEVKNQLPEGFQIDEYFVLNNRGYVVKRETIGTVLEEPIKITDENGLPVERKIGSVIPDFTLNFSSSLQYKKFNFYCLLGWQQGGQTYNHMRRYMMINGVGEILDQSGKAWNEVKSAKYYESLTRWNNDFFVEDASFLKVREVSLSYSMGEEILKNYLGIKKVRIGLSGRNLFSLTKYTGFDPETGKSKDGVDANVLKFDLSGYPSYATLTANIQFTF